MYEKIYGGSLQETSYKTIIPYRSGYAVVGTSFSELFTEGVNLNTNHNSSQNTDICISALYPYPDPLRVNTNIVRKEQLKVYPNPATDKVRIQIPTNDTRGTLTVTDIQGNAVYRQSVTHATIDIKISVWTKGVYMVEWTGNGERTVVEKLVIE